MPRTGTSLVAETATKEASHVRTSPDTRVARRAGIAAATLMALSTLVMLPSNGSAESPAAVAATAATRAVPDRLDLPRQVGDVTPAYSDPEWYPLREPAWISCARTNCFRGTYHGYWAQDWTGQAFEKAVPDVPEAYDFEIHPVYAAGAGQVEIVRNEEKCGPDQGSSEGNGTILQIDHGGGVFSVYKHLDIEVQTGDWVTPRTRIGTMAAWGSNGCNTAYVHFEIVTGNNRRRIPFDDLRACARAEVELPDDLTPYDPKPDDGIDPRPYTSWDDITPYFTVAKADRDPLRVPRMNDSCIPTSFATPATPTRPRVAVGRLTSVVVAMPAVPQGVGASMLARQVRFPDGSWSDPVWTEVPVETTRLTVDGLSTGRTYRFTVAHRNREGWSQWSNGTAVIVGAVPKAPYAPKRLTVASTAIGMAWERAENQGYPVTGYRLQIRQYTRAGWGEWQNVELTTETFYRFTGLTPRRDYQLRVRALSAIGPSPFSDTVSVTTPRS